MNINDFLDKWLKDRQVEEEGKCQQADAADNKRMLNIKHAECFAESETKPKQATTTHISQANLNYWNNS